ncbi:hypothetical protein C922_02731 [Plasmodium inui San Antonio 1]|uniref:Uncharacterized protein n=1 Tax=Plasmodium inui San Antonio 1 TaxID=1237626 RepID=W7AN62_9APIC|nr:hypothetical protein C922_02731 [Plasmodium inui San Antonio 1]EUD66746.1 hypothetical protein C922_02731 [Plasmodium inui San Antonio 1]
MDEPLGDEDPCLTTQGRKKDPLTNRNKIENLKGSIDNLLNDGNPLSDLEALKESLAQLELYSERNNEDLDIHLGTTERISSAYNDRTCAQLRRELLKQKNLNWCLSLKVRSIHMKLNSLYAKKDQLERSVQNRMREIELQFLPGGGNPGASADQVGVLQKERPRVDPPNEDALNEEKKKVEELKQMLVKHERSIEVSEIEKVKSELELKTCKDKLKEQIERNESLYRKIKIYEANLQRVKKEGEKHLDELDELRVQLQKCRGVKSQVEERNKLLQEEKVKLVQANNELKIRLQRVQTCLSDSRHKERAFASCSRKIMGVVAFLRESDTGGGFAHGKYGGAMSDTLVDPLVDPLVNPLVNPLGDPLGDTLGDTLGDPLGHTTTFAQTELQLDAIWASIRVLVGVKREFEGQRDELERARAEAHAAKRELERKRWSYEEVKQQMDQLQTRQQRNEEEVTTAKEKDERTIMQLRQTLREEVKQTNEYKNRNEYNLMRIRRLKRRENKILFQMNQLRRYVQENKSNLEQANELSSNQIRHIKKRNKQLITNLDDIKVQLQKSLGHLNTVNKNMKVVEREKEKLTHQMHILQSQNGELVKELQTGRKKNEAMKMRIYTMNSRIGKIKEKMRSANMRLIKIAKHHSKRNRSYREELCRKNGYLEEVQMKVKKLQEELKEKEKTIQRNDECLHKLEEAIKRYEQEKDNLSEEIKKKNLLIASKEEKIDKMSNIESDLLKEGKEKQLKLIQRNKEIESNLLQLKQMKVENVKLNDMIGKVKKELINSELRCKMAYRDLDKLKKEKKKIITGLQNDLKEKEKCLQMTDQRVELLRRERNDCQFSIQHELKLLQNQVAELTAEKETYRGKVDQLNNELQQSQQRLKEQIAINEESKKQNEGLSNQVDEWQKRIDKQDEEMKTLRKKQETSERKKMEEYKNNEETLKKQFEEEKQNMKRQFEALMKTEKEAQQEQIKQMMIQKEKEMEQLFKETKAEKERCQRDVESMTERHKRVVIQMKEETQKEINQMKDICEQSRKAQLLEMEKEKNLQSKIDECTSLLKEKDEEFRLAIREYDQKLQAQNREMETLVNECEQKLREARTARRAGTSTSGSAEEKGKVEKLEKMDNCVKGGDEEVSNRATASIAQLQESLRGSETKISQLEKELLDSRRELAELSQKNRDLANRKAEADIQVANLVAENERLKEERPDTSLAMKEETLPVVEKKKKKKHKKDTSRKGHHEKEQNYDEGGQINEGSNTKEEMEETEERKKTSDKKNKTSSRRKEGKGRTGLENGDDKDDGNHHDDDDTREETEEGDTLFDADSHKLPLSHVSTYEKNCYVFLKGINVKLDEIVDKLKAKEDPLLINDALNKINVAISAWNLFADPNAETAEEPDEGFAPDEEVLSHEEPLSDGEAAQGDEGETTDADIDGGDFSDERYQALKREVSEKVELIHQMV